MEQLTDSPVFDSRHRLVLQNPVLSRQQRRVALATLVLPALGTVLALLWSWKYGLANITVMTTLALYAFTTAGLTVGYHRCFTHRSFNARALTKALLAIGAMMAAQGPLLFWAHQSAAGHRRHDGCARTAALLGRIAQAPSRSQRSRR
jgi:stearoyl-CoA desaturase (delta-9 desaturase)